MDPALKALVAKINKQMGSGAVVLGSDLISDQIPRLTSGSLSLDVILGGGWPANQWNELVGEPSSGKTTVVLKTIAANQARDPEWTAWWVASEPFDKVFAKMMGVDISRVLVHDTNVMEEAYDQILAVAESRLVDCIVIDSISYLMPAREDDDPSGSSAVGAGALLTNRFFRKQGSATRRSLTETDRPITGFVVNQWREKIGVMHGDPRTTPGGKGKDYAYFTRVEVRRDDWIKQNDEPIGQVIKATTIKNKSHRPRRVATFDIYFEHHLVDDEILHRAGEYDSLKEIVDVAITYGVIEARGAWLFYGDQKWNGRPALRPAVLENPDLAAAISRDVLAIVTKTSATPAVDEPPKKLRKAS